MSDQSPPRFRHRVGRVLGHAAVVIGILAVIAAAFWLSYDPVRDIARAAGVPVTLARIYPGIFDAVFLVACAAALMLRDARWWTRLYAWLSVLVTGGLIGAADVYHAAGLRLPHRITAGTIAALPWALVMLAFSLWLSMLRHSKSGRALPTGAGPSDAETAYPDEPAAPAPALALEPVTAARAALPAADPAEPMNDLERPLPQHEAAAEATPDVSPAAPVDHEPGSGGVGNHSKDQGEVADDEALGDQPAGPRSSSDPHPSDADTPPYGFPAITDEVPRNGSAPNEAPAPRTPTLLSAPVPADVADPDLETSAPSEATDPAPDPDPARAARTDDASSKPAAADLGLPTAEATATPGPTGSAGAAAPEVAEDAAAKPEDADPAPQPAKDATEPTEAPAEPEEVAAKGRPPAANAELPVAEAELAHEDRPTNGATPLAPREDEPPAERRPHRPFERVRSTPTPPSD